MDAQIKQYLLQLVKRTLRKRKRTSNQNAQKHFNELTWRTVYEQRCVSRTDFLLFFFLTFGITVCLFDIRCQILLRSSVRHVVYTNHTFISHCIYWNKNRIFLSEFRIHFGCECNKIFTNWRRFRTYHEVVSFIFLLKNLFLVGNFCYSNVT